MRSCSLRLFFTFGIAAPMFAVSYVVPADRFEIERSSAIVVGRVLSSRVERSPRFGIETITDVVLEEAIKGNVGVIIRIHEPGGVLGDEARVIPGVLDFTEGARVLLFLYQRENGEYTVNDLQLGSFHFAKDVLGRDLVIRNELDGWDPDGTAHQERPRAAESFIDYIRGVVRGEAVAEDYFVSKVPLAGATETATAKPDAVFTATSYTLAYGSGLGTRWNVFPGAVNWNQGNSETGALGSGTPQINAAFGAWNGAGAHYVLASANANAKGFLDAADGVNNIVFEKNLTAAGVQPFNCASGGVLGMGGMHSALFGAGNHVFHGETFGTTLEADVSMNQGLANCTTNQVTFDQFNSVIVHELGHTLGFRHSDQNRNLTAPCSTDPTLDCSNQAIMNHILVSGLNGKLQPWDSSAMSNVYGNGPACTPVVLGTPRATLVSGGFQLSITASGGNSFTYRWFQGATTGAGAQIGTGNPLLVNPLQTASYWCRVTNDCSSTADSTVVTATIVPCSAPQIVNQPQDQEAVAGTAVSLMVDFIGTTPAVSWFQGAKGDTSTQVGSGQTITSPVLRQTTQFWERIGNSCGSVDSNAATITVKLARGRAVRH